ncbi:MAG: biotin--[acetyl-CoA-carboxylase] ligase [Faecalimonas sp.]|nr:biotin--[acetyl-CoA-carboxylase] ligase [Faecalimonas sp.]
MENKKIRYYEQLDSTNTKVSELALEGADHGTVVVAGCQTAGKGRRGRLWESPAEDNIYTSILLRPDFATEKAPMITLVMAYSVAKVLQENGFADVQIKWPNDLVLSGKKVCGILTELYLHGTAIDYIVVGVGVNVNTSVFSEELVDKATSLFLECGKLLDKEQLIVDIVDTFMEMYDRFAEVGNLEFLQEAYNAILVNKDKVVRILEPENEYTAYAHGINGTGELVVQLEDGTEKNVYAGEVSVRGLYGYIR